MKEGLSQRLCGDGMSISSAKRTSYWGEDARLSFCCLNVFTFLSVNIKDFYCAFKQAAAAPTPSTPSSPRPTPAICQFIQVFFFFFLLTVQGPK